MTFDSVRGRLLLAGIYPVGGVHVSELWERYPLANSQPSWTAYGSGCAGSAGVPTLAPATGQLPRIGLPFTVHVAGVPPGPLRQTFGLLGASRTTWSGVPLPFDLGLIGMPGCMLHVAGELASSLTAVSGVASWAVPLPYDVALIGAKAYQQALIVDPGTNLLGAIVSNAGEMVLGL